MRDSVRTATVLGGIGLLCGGCVSLAYVLLTVAAASLGIWFWGLVALVPLLPLGAAALYFRVLRSPDRCDVPQADG